MYEAKRIREVLMFSTTFRLATHFHFPRSLFALPCAAKPRHPWLGFPRRVKMGT
ncbi:hypothetical protein QWZ13_13705 [Reinekea marina]|uniref:hypothetical protein n=1 Tax=Reinekea marina TaxID=1310421 RepID=UPI0025B2EED7|nr:hypothetical protein [Reinekea marina]MDN3649970.1 hypothetical protein [Reinekea marina]